MSNNNEGVNTSSKNVANVKAQATPVATSANRKSGKAYDASDNLITVDATASLPANCVFVRGIAHTQDGRMCTTTGTPALTGFKIGSMSVRSDGAVHITTAAITTASTKHLGRAFDALGRMHVKSN